MARQAASAAGRLIPLNVGEAVEAWPADAVEVGRVVGAWGVKGGLKIQPHASDPQGLFSSKRWFLAAPAGAVPPSAEAVRYPCMLRVAQARSHGDGVVATIHDLTDRDVAQALAGARVHIPRSSFPTPGTDEFYWVDLIGCQVTNREGIGLGEVTRLQETGPHCVLVLSSSDAQGQPRMVPFVSAYVDRVDLGARRIDVDWPMDF